MQFNEVNLIKYDDELEWLKFRTETMEKGYMKRNERVHTLLFMDSDTGMTGYDLYATNSHIVMEKWERTEIASFVMAQTKRAKMENAPSLLEQFGNWLNEYRGVDEYNDSDQRESETKTEDDKSICNVAISA